MLAVTVSSKFQVVIPQSVRAQMHIEAGQQFQMLAYDRRIELLPIEPPAQVRGFLPGLDTTVARDNDRT